MSYLMIVEDNALAAELMRRHCKKLDDRPVEIFNSAFKAQSRLDIGLPDLAFLDVNLGSHTSFDVARRLVEHDIPTFFITSYSAESLVRLGATPDLLEIRTLPKESMYAELRAILERQETKKPPH